MRVIIHPGMHKTGTSSIQNHFFNTAYESISYPRWNSGNLCGLFILLFQEEKLLCDYHGFRTRGPEFLKTLPQLKKQWLTSLEEDMQASSGKTMIFSAEDISEPSFGVAVENMAAFFRRWTDNISVIGYARKPLSFAVSAFQQDLKGDGLHELNAHSFWPNYSARFRNLEKIFGRDHVTLRVYEPTHLHKGDVVCDFAHLIGIDVANDTSPKDNVSLSAEATALLYTQRKLGDGFVSGFSSAQDANATFIDALRKIGCSQFTLSDSLWAPCLTSNSEDLAWIEDRVGISMLDKPAANSLIFSSEDDIFQLAVDSYFDLNRLLPKHLQSDKGASLERTVQSLNLLRELSYSKFYPECQQNGVSISADGKKNDVDPIFVNTFHHQADDSSEERMLFEVSLAAFKRDEFYLSAFLLRKLLQEDRNNVTVLELLLKSLAKMDAIDELQAVMEEYAPIWIATPGLQMAVFDALILSNRYYEAFSHVWLCLTSNFNKDVLEYFRHALLAAEVRMPNLSEALGDLSTDIITDPINRIILSFSRFQLPSIDVQEINTAWKKASSKASSRLSLGKVMVNQSAASDNDTRSKILIVSHELSRTGAPIVVFNLARYLAKKYHVTIFSFAPGELFEEILEVADKIIVSNGSIGLDGDTDSMLADLCHSQEFDFAIVNSIVSYRAFRTLSEACIPSIALVHEFASNAIAHSAFAQIERFASQVVFSTNVTRTDAVEVTGIEAFLTSPVLPQGRCLIPATRDSAINAEKEQYKLRHLLRPKELEDDFLVIGVGTVDFRKGVDIFIEIARKTIKMNPSRRVRFVWIGAGYRPDEDYYSAFLSDQIKRSGLGDSCIFIDSTPEITTAYTLADALILSSRLDPLPNVAIDAICEGLPVFCFEQASGIPEFVQEAGVADLLVAEYLNTSDMAALIFEVIKEEKTAIAIRQALKAYAGKRFSFETYVVEIERLVRLAK